MLNTMTIIYTPEIAHKFTAVSSNHRHYVHGLLYTVIQVNAAHNIKYSDCQYRAMQNNTCPRGLTSGTNGVIILKKARLAEFKSPIYMSMQTPTLTIHVSQYNHHTSVMYIAIYLSGNIHTHSGHEVPVENTPTQHP